MIRGLIVPCLMFPLDFQTFEASAINGGQRADDSHIVVICTVLGACIRNSLNEISGSSNLFVSITSSFNTSLPHLLFVSFWKSLI